MVRIVFKVDGASYEGDTFEMIVRKMLADSHDRTTDLAVFRMSVSRRARQMYRAKVNTDTNYKFIKDLERLGEGKLIKTLL